MKVKSIAMAVSLLFSGAAFAAETLTVVSFGGDTRKREDITLNKPFEEETGIRVDVVEYSGGNAQIRAQVESGAVTWDVVNGEAYMALKGCSEGLLEDISDWPLPAAPDGTPAKDDYLPGALSPCGVGMTTYAVQFAYQSDLPVKPESIADVFDTQKIPGKRGLYKRPLYVLEFALQADGAKPSEVHDLLRTEEGIERAFRKLDTIKNDVIWWDSWSQGSQLVADKEVVIGMGSSTRFRVAKSQRNLPIDILYKGQIVEIDSLMIPKGARNIEAAKKYIAFVTRPDVASSIYVPAAEFKGGPNDLRPQSFPVRRSALKAIRFDEADKPAIEQLVDATPETSEFLFDDGAFWSTHRDELEARFAAWLLQ